MKRLLFSLSVFLLSATAFAAPRSLQQMKEAAKSVLKAAPAATRGGGAQLEVMRQGAQLTVLGYTTGGFAVIANDDAFNAVLGYSDTQFSPDNMPPALQWWMDAAEAAMQQRLASGATTRSTTTPADQGYPAEIGGDYGLIETRWDQLAPYNNIVSSRFAGANVYTGCVATAMAQIMYYHKFPTKGQGRNSYRVVSADPSTNDKQLGVSFNTTYDWDNMLPIYTTGRYTTEEADAVAKLMFHCGVAVEMSYGTAAVGGSGAHDNDAANALQQYFLYSTKFYARDIYTEREWMDIIYEEISNNRPVLYGGITATLSGHAFVFDGYDASGRVHVNWGWSGSGNGFFDVALLDSRQGSFSYDQDMVVIHDANEPQIPYSSQWGLADSYQHNEKGSFTVSVMNMQLTYKATFLQQKDAAAFDGNIGLLAQPVDGGTPIVLDNLNISEQVGRPIEYYSAYNLGNRASIATLPDGTYRVYMASKATTETEWQPVRSNETIVNNYIITKRGTSVTVDEGEPGWTTGIESVTVTGGNGGGTVRVYTADGVLVYTAPAAGFRLDDVPARGLLIVKRGAETVKVVKK